MNTKVIKDYLVSQDHDFEALPLKYCRYSPSRGVVEVHIIGSPKQINIGFIDLLDFVYNKAN